MYWALIVNIVLLIALVALYLRLDQMRQRSLLWVKLREYKKRRTESRSQDHQDDS